MKHDHIRNPEFHEMMSLMAEQSGQPTSDFKDRMYAEGLADIPMEQLKAAVWALVKTRVFASFPKIGEIRDAIGGKAEDQAEVQAALVWDTIRRFGSTRTVMFDDSVTMAVITRSFGGWQKLCAEMMEDKLQWFIKDFAKHYIAFKRSGVHHYEPLPGWADPYGKGPELIGNKAKAQELLQHQEKSTPMGQMVKQIAGLK